MSRRTWLALLLPPVAWTLAGCASRSWEGGRRGSTVGHNLRDAPPGRVIPATGLGVDLVDSGATVDQDVTTTSAAVDEQGSSPPLR